VKRLKLKLLTITVATMTIATISSIRASAAWIQNEGNRRNKDRLD
jgi:fructan beta-fructosidase